MSSARSAKSGARGRRIGGVLVERCQEAKDVGGGVERVRPVAEAVNDDGARAVRVVGHRKVARLGVVAQGRAHHPRLGLARHGGARPTKPLRLALLPLDAQDGGLVLAKEGAELALVGVGEGLLDGEAVFAVEGHHRVVGALAVVVGHCGVRWFVGGVCLLLSVLWTCEVGWGLGVFFFVKNKI